MGVITNNPRFIEGPPPPVEELLGGPSDEQLADEVAQVFGGAADAPLPPVSIGALMVLDAIRSPFVTGNADAVTLSDIVVAMFVITNPAPAAKLVPSHVYTARAERAFDKTAKTPEHLDKYLGRIALEDKLVAAATEWADGLQDFSPAQAVIDIGEMMKLAMTGWTMIPSKDGEEKKTGD
jgi:hypothetical protein